MQSIDAAYCYRQSGVVSLHVLTVLVTILRALMKQMNLEPRNHLLAGGRDPSMGDMCRPIANENDREMRCGMRTNYDVLHYKNLCGGGDAACCYHYCVNLLILLLS